jgi:hypothetical protein
MPGRVKEAKEWTRDKGRVLLRQGSAVVTCYRHPSLPGLFIAPDITRPNSARHPRKRHWTVTHSKTGLMVACTKTLMLLRDVKRLSLMHLQGIDWTRGPGVLSSDPQAKLAKTLLNVSLGGDTTYEAFRKRGEP